MVDKENSKGISGEVLPPARPQGDGVGSVALPAALANVPVIRGLAWPRLWQFRNAKALLDAFSAAVEADIRRRKAENELDLVKGEALDLGTIIATDRDERQARRIRAEKAKRLAELEGDRRIVEEEIALDALRRKRARSADVAEDRVSKNPADQYARDLRQTIDVSRSLRAERDRLIAEIIHSRGGEDKLTDEDRLDIENIRDATDALLTNLKLDAE